MVWFQCEDCGDNLRKPKLANHFRTCSAHKLSCIDCGQIFGQDTVQDHTQCITEAEKYGPKGQNKPLNVTTAKPNKDAKKQSDIDISVGLSERPPWFCSLCNTKATSKQTLLLHAEGKKHKAKARAFCAAKQQPTQTDKSAPDVKLPIENAPSDELQDDKNVDQPKLQDPSKHNDTKSGNGISPSKKKRKPDALEADSKSKRSKNETLGEMGNGEVIQVEGAESDVKRKIKWKKFIKSALKSSPDGILKMKKLRKLVFKALQESNIMVDETKLDEALHQKINSSSKFALENKYVRLVVARD